MDKDLNRPKSSYFHVTENAVPRIKLSGEDDGAGCDNALLNLILPLLDKYRANSTPGKNKKE